MENPSQGLTSASVCDENWQDTHTHLILKQVWNVQEKMQGKILLLNRLDLIIFKKHVSIYS